MHILEYELLAVGQDILKTSNSGICAIGTLEGGALVTVSLRRTRHRAKGKRGASPSMKQQFAVK